MLTQRSLAPMMWSRTVIPNSFSGFRQLLRDLMVLSAGRRVTAGMIVNQQNCRGGIPNRWPKHFSWMHQTGRQSPDRDAVRVDRLVFCVQRDDMEFFLDRVTRQPRKLNPTIFDGFAGTGDLDFLLNVNCLQSSDSTTE